MIEVSHLSYRYGRKRPAVFENVSFSLEPGRIYGLLGKNGTGKSTLLYLLSGLLFPQEGSVKYHGLEMRERRPEALGDLYLLPETFRLPNMSLKNYVRLHAPFYPNYSEQLMHSSLEEFDLTPDVHLGQLSMGQQKKAYLSFALATNTSLLLMDEPSNGLDIPSKSQFRRAVARAMTDERTVVIDETATPIYSQHTLGGEAGIFTRQAGEDETKLNLELLFNATLTAGERMEQVFTNLEK